MNNFWEGLFQNGMQAAGMEFRPSDQSRGPPPASQRAIRQLPTVIVSPEDLVDPNNRECCICLEENNLKDRVTRLPCAHIFHQCCVQDWLQKNCTCPVCRYELPTDDPAYESSREERMRHRKPRFALYELERMSIRELRELIERLRVDASHLLVVEKRELVQILVTSDRVDIIAAPEPVEYPLSLLRCMGIGQLKRCMEDAGVFFDPIDALEKEDLVRIFINSGRLVILPEVEQSTPDHGTDDSRQRVLSESARTIPEARRKRKLATRRPVVTTVEGSDDDLDMYSSDDDFIDNPNDNYNSFRADDMSTHSDEQTSSSQHEYSSSTPAEPSRYEESSISELRALATRLQVDISDCIEKAEMIERLVDLSQRSELNERSISELRALARRFNVDISDCIERTEMVERLVNVPEMNDSALFDAESLSGYSVSELRALANEVGVDLSMCRNRTAMIEQMVDAAIAHRHVANYMEALTPLARLTVPQLRAVAREWRVNISDCLEKGEMIHRLVAAGGPVN